jgi:hypothetical protein
VFRSQLWHESIEAGTLLLKESAEGDLSGLELLANWIDGPLPAGHHVICAVGADTKGSKHTLGLREGAPRTRRWPRRCWRTWCVGASI